jgi:cytochrome c oxidase subunit IV
MVVMCLIWDYLRRAYDNFLLPFLGFFFLPTTTLAYAVAQNETDGLNRWALVVFIVALLIDLGIWGGGRGAFKRR